MNQLNLTATNIDKKNFILHHKFVTHIDISRYRQNAIQLHEINYKADKLIKVESMEQLLRVSSNQVPFKFEFMRSIGYSLVYWKCLGIIEVISTFMKLMQSILVKEVHLGYKSLEIDANHYGSSPWPYVPAVPLRSVIGGLWIEQTQLRLLVRWPAAYQRLKGSLEGPGGLPGSGSAWSSALILVTSNRILSLSCCSRPSKYSPNESVLLDGCTLPSSASFAIPLKNSPISPKPIKSLQSEADMRALVLYHLRWHQQIAFSSPSSH